MKPVKCTAFMLTVVIMLSLLPSAVFCENDRPISISVISEEPMLYENVDGRYRNINSSEFDGDMWFCYSIPAASIVIEAAYESGDTKIFSYRDFFGDIGNGFYIRDNQSAAQPWGVGRHEARLEYLGLETVFYVNVVPSPVKSIEVEAEEVVLYEDLDGSYAEDISSGKPVRWFSYSLEKIKKLPVTVELTDGSEVKCENFRDIEKKLGFTPELVCDQAPDNQWKPGEHEVRYILHGASDTVELQVAENPVSGIELAEGSLELTEETDGCFAEGVDASGNRVEYFHYDLSRCNLTIKVNYTDGSVRYIREKDVIGEEYSLMIHDNQSAVKPWLPGEHTVKVSYMGRETEITVEVVRDLTESVEIVHMPKETYYSDELPDLTGIVLRINMSDGTYVDTELDNDVIGWSATGMMLNGNALSCSMRQDTFIIEYRGMTAQKKLTVIPRPAYVSAEVKTEPITVGGKGMVIAAEDSEGTVTEFTVLAADINGGAEYVKTDKGIFKGYSAMEVYSKEYAAYVYTYTFRGQSLTVRSNAKTLSGERALNTVMYLLMLSDGELPDRVCYDGITTEENVDAIVRASMLIASNMMPRPYYTAAQIQKVVDKVFYKTKLSLELSPCYNAETDEYRYDTTSLKGSYDVSVEEVWQNDYGCYMARVYYSETAGYGTEAESGTLYLYFDTTGKIKFIDKAVHSPGDVDGNGKRNIMDLFLFKKYYKKLAEPVGKKYFLSDMNCDGNINVRDYFFLKKAIKGM